MGDLPETVDVAIVGSGIGGSTIAFGLAGSGARIAVLERGCHLGAHPAARDARAIFQRGVFRPVETWLDAHGRRFNPGNYYYVGGNSKFYGAVLIRYRERDFAALEHWDGVSPAWPFGMKGRSLGIAAPNSCLRCAVRLARIRPSRRIPLRIPQRRCRMNRPSRRIVLGLHHWGCIRSHCHWRSMLIAGSSRHRHRGMLSLTRTAASSMRRRRLAHALKHNAVSLHTDVQVMRLLPSPDGKRIVALDVVAGGERRRLRAKLFVLSAGAVNSAALLLRSGNIANTSGVVGRYFMNHNSTALLAVDPRHCNDAVYQKTIGLNDFYFGDGAGGKPPGNMQLLGKVTAPILKVSLPLVPEAALRWLARHSVDWYLMSEDLPHPDNRVAIDGPDIVLHWQRTNMTAHRRLVAKARDVFRAAGYPFVLTRAFDRRTPSHQCGTVRMGTDPATSALDVFCRTHDHANLFVVDAAFLPTSAAVNPSLTIAAQALRVADHILQEGFRV